MPLYLYRCDECKREMEVIQNYDGSPPFCCDEVMTKVPQNSLVRMKTGGTINRSRGYKDGYSKEYKRSLEDVG